MHRMLVAVLVGSATSAAAQSLPPVKEARRLADSLARAFVAEQGSPSVAVAVVRGRDTILMQGYGFADLENEVAATARTVYRIGSVTKQFASAAVMQLVDQGKVRIEDSIGSYLPTLPAGWRPVTVKQLLNHTSGIPSYTALGRAWQSRWGEEMTPDTIVALSAAKPMDFAPGTKWAYNNSGYVILGMLIEKITGRSWGADLEERFARPLGLADTKSCLTQPLIPRRAHGYDPGPGGWTNTAFLAMSQPYSAGAMCSTVGDLVRWNRALHTGKVVSAASYALMTTPEGAAADGERRYGFGLQRDSVGGQPAVSNGGGINGFITANTWVPGAELSITVLTNSGAARSSDLLRQLGRAAMGVPLDRPPPTVPLAAADRGRYLGVYALDFGGTVMEFTVAVAGDQLTGQITGQSATPMRHLGNHTFGVSFDPTVRLVFTVEGDRATKMTLVQGGRRTEGARK
ncbi:MAG: serine hydrolase domain-containing protein [Gemmatimonadales bacterium]